MEACQIPFEKLISVLGPQDALSWYPSASDSFFEATLDTLTPLREWLTTLSDGTTLAIRGRDWSGPCGDTTPWEYGYAMKDKDTLFFVYEDGKIEWFAIDILNFVDLVHLAKVTDNMLQKLLGPPADIDPDKVIILSHGWSEHLGPNYPLIRTLQRVATQKGWKVIVPDFRATYQYGHNRGRSERVRMIYSEILCLDPKPKTLLLVGHSQGGAASSFACENRVVKAQNIKGLLLIGSENPISMDGMDWNPEVPLTWFIHSDGDQVVWPIQKWGVPFIKITPQAKKDPRGDCFYHDFLLKELMVEVVDLFLEFLDKSLDVSENGKKDGEKKVGGEEEGEKVKEALKQKKKRDTGKGKGKGKDKDDSSV